MLRAVIFDLDGTIVDSLDVTIECANRLAKKKQMPSISEEQFHRLREMELKDALNKELKIPLWKIPLYAAMIREEMKGLITRFKIFPGMKRLIRELGERYAVGILTSNSEKIAEEIMEANCIRGIRFIHSDKLFFGKRLVLNHIMRKYHLKNDEIVYIGDEARDVIACRKAKVRCIAVTWGYNSEKRLLKERPYAIAKSPDGLLEIIKSI